MKSKGDDWIDRLAGVVFTAIIAAVAFVSKGIARFIMSIFGLDEGSWLGWTVFMVLTFGLMILICSIPSLF